VTGHEDPGGLRMAMAGIQAMLELSGGGSTHAIPAMERRHRGDRGGGMATADCLSFEFAEDGVTLLARFAPDGEPAGVSKQWLRQQLIQHGYGELCIFDEGLDSLETACKAGSEPAEIRIAEKRDAKVDLGIDKDGMSAYLTVSPPNGGAPLDREMLRSVLYDNGICHGVRMDAIKDLVMVGIGDNVLIACGTPPEHGRDAWFEPLTVQDDNRGRPKELPDGTVDFYELGTVESVVVGQPLLRKHPATSGTPGTTVTGLPIPARPGRDIAFGPMGDSVAVDATDPMLILAAKGGLPRYGKSWVKVEPTLILKTVDLSTGNVRFDGNIIINGPVQAGLSVWAAGDIVVEGAVEAATIEAGGNIELRAGVIGQGEGMLKAGGNVMARFVESATIEAGQEVHVIDILLHSRVMALDSVFVQGGRKAQIIGGQTHATRLIRAAVCGSPSGVVTEMSIGLNPYFKRQHDELAKELEIKQRKVDEMGKLLIQRRLRPDPSKAWEVNHLAGLREKLSQEVALLIEKVEELAGKLEMAKNAKVTINDRVFGGVKIVIGDQIKWIKEDMTGCGFRLRHGEIVLTLPTSV
jgi:uncharacterized protein (DUF342 family)